jgi:hypothetical protein
MAKTAEEPREPLVKHSPNDETKKGRPFTPELQARITYLWNRGYDK